MSISDQRQLAAWLGLVANSPRRDVRPGLAPPPDKGLRLYKPTAKRQPT